MNPHPGNIDRIIFDDLREDGLGVVEYDPHHVWTEEDQRAKSAALRRTEGKPPRPPGPEKPHREIQASRKRQRQARKANRK